MVIAWVCLWVRRPQSNHESKEQSESESELQTGVTNTAVSPTVRANKH